MRMPIEYSSLNVPAELKKVLHLQMSFKKRMPYPEQIDELRHNAKVQQILLTQINKLVSLMNKVRKFRESILK